MAETYKDEAGDIQVLGKVEWVKGDGQIQRRYFAVPRPFEIFELAFFPKANLEARSLAATLKDVTFFETWPRFMARVSGVFEIGDYDLAFQLAQKAQGIKDPGDVSGFMQDYMLNTPIAIDEAKDLLIKETDLAQENARESRKAEAQIEVLRGVKEKYADLGENQTRRAVVAEAKAHLKGYIDRHEASHRRVELTDVLSQIAVGMVKEQELQNRISDHEREIDELRQRRFEAGGGRIDELDRRIREFEVRMPSITAESECYRKAAETIGFTLPRTADAHAESQHAVRDACEAARVSQEAAVRLVVEIEGQIAALKDQKKSIQEQIDSIRQTGSSLDPDRVRVREDICASLGVEREELPFAAELLEVKNTERAWRGHIEEYLGGFARRLLVRENLYKQVSDYVEGHVGRFQYLRIAPHHGIERGIRPGTVPDKLMVKEGPLKEWLEEELTTFYNSNCVNNMEEFRRLDNAISSGGQIKRNGRIHDKTAAKSLSRSDWVLGFSAKEKLTECEASLAILEKQIDNEREVLEEAQKKQEVGKARQRALDQLINKAWEDIDIEGLAARYENAKRQREEFAMASDRLLVLDGQIKEEEGRKAAIKKELEDLIRKQGATQRKAEVLKKDIELLDQDAALSIPPSVEEELSKRLEAALAKARETGDFITLRNRTAVALDADENHYDLRIGELKDDLIGKFNKFITTWKEEDANQKPTIEYAESFIQIYERLERDDLPRLRARFNEELEGIIDRRFKDLVNQINLAEREIQSRMQVLNEALERTIFDRGNMTHLFVQYDQKKNENGRAFSELARQILGRAIDKEQGQSRFQRLEEVVERLRSGAPVDADWRHDVLDVRKNAHFLIKEIDKNGVIRNVYKDFASRSGGQRQSLAAYIIAGALRYQLAGRDRQLPRFCTVIIDEAFNATDNTFAEDLIKSFKDMGFQLIMITPGKSLEYMQRFVGSATIVSNNGEKNSSSLASIEYIKKEHRLAYIPRFDVDE
jgi:uncharacterized protein YPO0396